MTLDDKLVFNPELPKDHIINQYFIFLLYKVDMIGTHYIELCKYLHGREFYALLALDENRSKDGQDLRNEFITNYIPETNNVIVEKSPLDEQFTCTIFEMLVGLASRCEKVMGDNKKGDRTGYWFKNFIFNLQLDKFDDTEFYQKVERYKLLDILETFLDRSYNRDGLGGLFPLKSPSKDQRKVEIWYQMMEWLKEKGYTDDYTVF